jgi:multidrug resistance efflux pump
MMLSGGTLAHEYENQAYELRQKARRLKRQAKKYRESGELEKAAELEKDATIRNLKATVKTAEAKLAKLGAIGLTMNIKL